MLGIPTIGPAIVVRERRLQALEGHVGAAHDGLPHVVEAVDHVPVVVVWDLVAGRQARVCLCDGELFIVCN